MFDQRQCKLLTPVWFYRLTLKNAIARANTRAHIFCVCMCICVCVDRVLNSPLLYLFWNTHCLLLPVDVQVCCWFQMLPVVSGCSQHLSLKSLGEWLSWHFLSCEYLNKDIEIAWRYIVTFSGKNICTMKTQFAYVNWFPGEFANEIIKETPRVHFAWRSSVGNIECAPPSHP